MGSNESGEFIVKKLVVIAVFLMIAACSSYKPSRQITLTSPITVPASADEVSMSAMSLIGTPYVWGGNTPESGFDCSGLIVYVYRNSGIKLPRTTIAMSSMISPSVRKNALQTGDLVFFATNGSRKVSHAGIYVGNGRFVHAPSSGGVVKLNNLNESYWSRNFVVGKRVIQN